MALLSCIFVEDMATSLGNVWRGIQMEGDSKVAALVGDPVQPKFVRHVCHLIFLIHRLRRHLHRLFSLAGREGIPSLGQVTTEDLHEAVGVAVVVDRASLAGRPHKDELCLSVRG